MPDNADINTKLAVLASEVGAIYQAQTRIEDKLDAVLGRVTDNRENIIKLQKDCTDATNEVDKLRDKSDRMDVIIGMFSLIAASIAGYLGGK